MSHPGPQELSTERKHCLRRARWLEIGTISYNVAEAGITVTAGLLKGSPALVSFGLDAAVEATSASVLLWRLTSEEQGVSQAALLRRKQISFYALSVVFVLLASFILYDSISKLLAQQQPNFSQIGFVILCVSLLINPFLSYRKRRVGKQLDSHELVMDSREQLICLYMTVIVLAGLLLNKYLGWWWADPAAALLIVPYVFYQAWQAFRDAREAGHQQIPAAN